MCASVNTHHSPDQTVKGGQFTDFNHGRTCEDIPSFVECTMKLCSDFQTVGFFSLFLDSVGFFSIRHLSAAPEGSLRVGRKGNTVPGDEPSDCDTQMNVIKQ